MTPTTAKHRLSVWLLSDIDNSALIFFRIAFGFILALQPLELLLTRVVQYEYAGSPFTFPYDGLGFLQPLPGNGMYYYFALQIVLGLMVMTGTLYRISIAAYTILWAAAFAMQETIYNNHFYLELLLCAILCISPAGSYAAIDTWRKPERRQTHCKQWVMALLMGQVAIIFTYAALNKLYPDWLSGRYLSLVCARKRNFPFVGWMYGIPATRYLLTYGGILFDLLIVPLMLWRKSRPYAFIACCIFAGFNFITFHIGLFPLMTIVMAALFFEPRQFNRVFFRNKHAVTPDALNSNKSDAALYFVYIYIAIQILLPMRPLLYPGNTMWTEDGNRFCWRMMLRDKKGVLQYRIYDPETRQRWTYEPGEELNAYDQAFVAVYPDMIWKYAQHIAVVWTKKGYPKAEIRASSMVSLNNYPAQEMIDTNTDLAHTPRQVFAHEKWIKPWQQPQ